jgi:hypothetical protein
VHPTNAFASATPDQFDQQMRWRKEHCDVIPLREALDRAAGDRDPRSKPAVAITFDDGYDDNFVHAYPILQRHGIEASFFVTTGFIDGDIRSRIRTSPSSGPKRSGPSSATPSAPLETHRGEEIDAIVYPFGIRGWHIQSDDRVGTRFRIQDRSLDPVSGRSMARRRAQHPTHQREEQHDTALESEDRGSLDIIGRWQDYRARGAFPVQDDGGTEDR